MITGNKKQSQDSLQERLAKGRLQVLAQLMDEMERSDIVDEIATAMQWWVTQSNSISSGSLVSWAQEYIN